MHWLKDSRVHTEVADVFIMKESLEFTRVCYQKKCEIVVTPAGKFFILVFCSGRGYSSRLGEAYHQLVNKFVGQQVFVELAALILSTSTATSQQPCFIWIIPTRANFLMLLAQAPTNSTVKNKLHALAQPQKLIYVVKICWSSI